MTVVAGLMGFGRTIYFSVFFYSFAANAFFLVGASRFVFYILLTLHAAAFSQNCCPPRCQQYSWTCGYCYSRPKEQAYHFSLSRRNVTITIHECPSPRVITATFYYMILGNPFYEECNYMKI
jgi:hypothetical protein